MHQYYVPTCTLAAAAATAAKSIRVRFIVFAFDKISDCFQYYNDHNNNNSIYIRERRHTHTRNIIYLFICQINRYLICDQHNNDDDDKT